MKRLLAFFLTSIVLLMPLLAQEENNENSEKKPNALYEYTFNRSGDQCIRIALGVVAPMNFPDFSSLFRKDEHQLSFGGIGSLGYRYFLLPVLAVGADASFGFNVTIGKHIFNYVPITANITFQPCFSKLEFPIALNLGFAWENYNNKSYFPGLIVKPELGIHYRINQSWSFGSDFAYIFMPQFMSLYESDGKDVFGHFLTLSIVAKYYF